MGATHFSGPVYSAGGFYVGETGVNASDVTVLAGVTPGTATASKALVLDSGKAIATITTITSTNVATGTLRALDATAGATIANSTGVITVSAGLTLSTVNIVTDTTTGTKIGTGATQKLGFFNATPVVQQSTTGTVTGYTSVGGSAVLSQSTFTGNSGSTAYTIGDIVLALKTLGFLAA
tara:strand:+ start:5301 stop:5837 length:537 start_codon:yes stop_codon:yes gene_type:complete